jgi:hypothetical protein
MILPIGIHPNVPAADYHADPAETPSLSSSIAKTILRQTPKHAWTEHSRLNPDHEPEAESKFDLGSVAHELILGKGGGFDIVDADAWTTKAAKEKRDASREAGRTPILAKHAIQAEDMMTAVRDRLKDIEECQGAFQQGHAETVLIWQDIGGPLCRAMIDWWGPTETEVYDLKTTGAGLGDEQIARTIDTLGYDLSAGFYVRGIEALRPELAGRIKWRWVFAETSAPFEVRVIEATRSTLEIGDRKAATAIEKWRQCIKTGIFPGYPARVDPLGLSDWAVNSWINRETYDEDARRAAFSSGARPVPAIPGEVKDTRWAG